ncbi:hypothetical protein G7061_01515 [Erysipelothrix sp. HDW6B]|uniref:VOC family protein n=1 Tax=Erysipelothrix TaxID=1647 RepID=UPI001359521D|nr:MULTISPECIES: VOC family protein [Erysipelothrix]QIK85374.1 hypothetical protein G7061_01515 [Erysipelothrix sp. HDW6B]
MIHHLEIYVNDLQRTRLFYDQLFKLLDYELYQTWDKGFSYRKHGTYIVFVQVEKPFESAGYHRKRIGLNHLAFGVTTPQDVDRIRDVLCSMGVVELYPEAYPHAGGADAYTFFFEDPDRIKLEIVACE